MPNCQNCDNAIEWEGFTTKFGSEIEYLECENCGILEVTQ